MKGVRTVLIVGLIAFGLLFAGLFWLLEKGAEPERNEIDLPEICHAETFAQADYIICIADPALHKFALHLRDDSGTPWKSLDRLVSDRTAKGEPVLLAMNAGMYREDLSPVGLFVENGREVTPLQTGSGDGNFFMKPNGVFGVSTDGKPFIMTTEVFALSKTVQAFATQSGPMLVTGGAMHPRFEPDGNSRFIRNGVGVDGRGRAVLVISKTAVSFGAFARLFVERLQCAEALYFDGVVSAFNNGNRTIAGGGFPAGPIISVSRLGGGATQ